MSVKVAADNEMFRCIKDLAESELMALYRETGIDLSDLPPISTTKALAATLDTTVDSLAQDRYRRVGIPFVRIGGGAGSRRIRYLRGDVVRHLLENRVGA